MADLNKELEELHADVIAAVRARLDIDPSSDNLRVALQLLKQNSVSAALSETDTTKLRSKMASKLNFSAMQEKVIPLRQSEAS